MSWCGLVPRGSRNVVGLAVATLKLLFGSSLNIDDLCLALILLVLVCLQKAMCLTTRALLFISRVSALILGGLV